MGNAKLRTSFWEHHHCLPMSRDLAPASIFDKNKHYLVFDVETKDLAPNGDFSLKNLAELGISVACAYDSKVDKVLTFYEEDLNQLVELIKNRLVIGYNIRRFDLPVMSGYGLKLEGLDVFDIMDEVERGLNRRFIKLQYVAVGTLGENEGKSADGKLAVEWYKQGKLKQIADYCAQDVLITTNVFKHGLNKKFLAVQWPDGKRKEFATDWT